MKNWLHSVISIITLVATAVSPEAQTAIGHHPVVSVVLGAVWAVLGHLLPSPVVQ